MQTVKPLKSTYTRKEIRLAYGISKGTFIKWCRNIPGFTDITGTKRILTQAEAALIFYKYGRPNTL